MADAIISMTLERLAAFAEEKIREEVNLVRGVKEEVHHLSSKLKTMRDVLEDAERRGFKEKTIQNWLKRLEDVSYDIDDVLDEWSFVALKLQIEGSKDFHLPRMKVCPPIQSSCMCFNKVSTRRDIAVKIKGLNEKLTVILNEKDEFNFIVNQPHVDHQDTIKGQSTSSIDLSDIHGRGDDKDVLVSKLMHEVAGQQLQVCPQVISIVGVGGIGKTTLAQFVFNDDLLVNCFKLRIWVCVSNVFDEVKIAKAILESVNGKSPDVNELNELVKHLEKSISRKKFLLVLDDVWTEDIDKWEPLKPLLNLVPLEVKFW
ncbi:UNVERIFIED_CONTAM: putative disease resistance protein RGA4 [Sesamum radiatum]|uniref:Disease resistance protein RGA4 n=1 Tax=Sesamum radiatum TaxID=300843 RepID=A0AAW2PH86_SESRA